MAKKIAKKKAPKKELRLAERTLKAFKVQEVINLSETILIRVLKEQTNLPFKTVANVALELYKRRVPAKTESVEGANKLTILKIVKNHVPIKKAETIDVTTDNIENATDAILKGVITDEPEHDV